MRAPDPEISNHGLTLLRQDIRACRLCADRFARTATAHVPRPVVWFGSNPRILIAGQAPGARVYQSGRPFTDPSGGRLRDWLGLSEPEFYDRTKIAIIPMAFCFPGYDAKGSDLPPPPMCHPAPHLPCSPRTRSAQCRARNPRRRSPNQNDERLLYKCSGIVARLSEDL